MMDNHKYKEYKEMNTSSVWQNLDAECAVLGTIIVESEAFNRVEKDFRVDIFYHPTNKIIAEAILKTQSSSNKIDLVTIFDTLQNMGKADLINEVVDMTQRVGSSAHLEEHMRIVVDVYTKRSIVDISQQTIRMIMDNEMPNKAISSAQVAFEMIEDGIYSDDKLKHVSELLNASIKLAYDRVARVRKGETSGITSGLTDLDSYLNGFDGGKLYVIGARPAMGKTAIALKLAKSASMTGKKVAIFSLEMSGESLADRLILGESTVDGDRYSSGYLSDADLNQIDKDINPLFNLGIYVDDNSNSTIRKMEAKSRYLQKREGCDMIIIDYLQLTDGDGNTFSREQEIASISRGAKNMSKNLNVPVILLSQLSRGVESRPDKKPLLSDLRESGAIEQDADVVMFIYRAEYYKQVLLDDSNIEIENGIELIIAKNRSGKTGSVYCQHDGTLNKIFDYNSSGGGFGNKSDVPF